jgi:integrase
VKITQKVADGLALPAGKKDFIGWDSELVGFGLRLREGGRRSWIIQYRFGALQRRMSIGTPVTLNAAQAREAARKLLAQVHLGRDPQAERGEARLAASNTLGAIVRQYLDHGRARWRPKTIAETERLLSRLWAPLLGLSVQALGRAPVAARIAEISRHHGGVTSNRARAAMSACLAWAVREGLAEANPVASTNKAVIERPRDRALSDFEIVDVWKACDGAGDYGAIVRLLLLLGQRRGEVGGICANEIDLAKRIWTIPPSRTKNGQQHIVPLPDGALAIIKQALAGGPTGYLFGRGRGFSGWAHAREALDKRIGATRDSESRPSDRFHIHDLRRTCAVGMQRLGVRTEVIEVALNHRSGVFRGIVGVYQTHDFLPERRRALDMWANHVEAIVDGQAGANIVPLRSAT